MLVAGEAFGLKSLCIATARLAAGVFLAALASRLRPVSVSTLDSIAAAAKREAQEAALVALRSALAAAPSESAILREGAAAARALFPASLAAAAGAFAMGTGEAGRPRVVACVAVVGSGEDAKAALAATLTPASAADASSSLFSACGGGGGSGGGSTRRSLVPPSSAADKPPDTLPGVRDSASTRKGLAVFSDWVAASSGGVHSARAITAPLTAGPVVVGFLTLHLDRFHVPERGAAATADELVRAVCDVVGASIFVRRAFALQHDTPGDAAGGGGGGGGNSRRLALQAGGGAAGGSVASPPSGPAFPAFSGFGCTPTASPPPPAPFAAAAAPPAAPRSAAPPPQPSPQQPLSSPPLPPPPPAAAASPLQPQPPPGLAADSAALADLDMRGPRDRAAHIYKVGNVETV